MTIECSQKMHSSAQICKARNYVDVSDNRRLEDFLDHLSDTPTTRPSMSLPSTINRFHILLKKTKPSILLDLGIERNTTSLQPLGDRRTLPSTTSMAPLNTSLHLLKLGLEVLDPMNDKRMQPHQNGRDLRSMGTLQILVQTITFQNQFLLPSPEPRLLLLDLFGEPLP